MSNLRSELQSIANQFVSSILSAMQSAPLSELSEHVGRGASAPSAAPRGRRLPGRPPKAVAVVRTTQAAKPAAGGRRRRASPEEVQKQKDVALSAAKALKPGFSKGDVIRKAGSKADLGRALSLLVAEGKLVKKGDRRLTRYWVK